MADTDKLKMRFKLHNLEFELEGKEEVVKDQFENFKSFITNELLPKINITTLQTPAAIEAGVNIPKYEIQDSEIIPTNDVPALKEVILKDLPKSEPDWILVYAYYATSFGEKMFTENDIKKQYEQTRRTNKSRLTNLPTNIKSLLNKEFIKVHNDTEFLIKPKGITYVLQILNGTSSIEKKSAKKATYKKQVIIDKKPSKKRPSSSTFSLDKSLNLRPDGKESLKDFANKYNLDSSSKQIIIIVYYLKEILGLQKVNGNHVYTGFEELNIRIPKSLPQLIINAKGRDGWLDYESNDDIKLSIQGRNVIKFDLPKKTK